MSTVVQLMARYVTKKKDHPWKGLAKTYSHYGTNGYYRKLMKRKLAIKGSGKATSAFRDG